MTIVMLIIAGVIILIAAALAFQTFKKNNSYQENQKAKPSRTKESPRPSSKGDIVKGDAPVAVTIAGYADSTDIYKDLRVHLTKGIDKIFSETPPDARTQTAPLTREQVKPQILANVMSHLEGMDQFRTRQFELQKLLNDPRSQLTELSRNITADPLLTAKVLKMANSSYFGFTQKMDSIGHAMMILGLQNVKNIMYRESLRGLFETGPAHNKAAVAELWRHSNLVCICTQHFHDLFEGLNRGTLFTLGIVHDIGKLILMNLAHMTVKQTGPGEEYPMDILIGEEDQIFGINHAVIGGCTLEQWNFSDLMSFTVAMHHAPSFVEAGDIKASPEMLKYVLALFLADQVARLFADWNQQTAQVYPLLKSYFNLIDKKKLIGKVIDINFLNQLQAAQMLAVSEYPLARPNTPTP